MVAVLRRTFLSMPLFAAAADLPPRVIAHRGAHAGHPENSLAAVRAGIEMGVHYVELDVRTAPDGTLVLKHDALAPGDVGLARFDEALALLAPSKTDLYLDWKAATAEALVEYLRRHGMTQRAVVYGSVEKLAALQKLEPAVRVMPEAVSVEHLRKTLETLHPRVIAFDRRDFNDPVIAVAKAARVDIFVDRLGADDNEAAWLDAWRRGATGIQTDKPKELLALLRREERG